MATFSEALTEDVDNIFLNVDEFAETVTLGRGTKSTTLAAMVQARTYESIGEHGRPVSIDSIDFDINRANYKLGDVPRDPRTGDLLTRPNGEIYEVQPLVNKKAFEPMAGGTLYRVHSRRVVRKTQ